MAICRTAKSTDDINDRFSWEIKSVDAVFTNGSLAPPPASSVSAKMADLSKEAILQAITDQDLRFLAVRRLHCTR